MKWFALFLDENERPGVRRVQCGRELESPVDSLEYETPEDKRTLAARIGYSLEPGIAVQFVVPTAARIMARYT